ncbi:acetoin utilization protein AcuC [Candidatus Bathyarchaeota archaeon]|nr:MAG: acetoin utilization protein AcuC [Candidatus Bathyarchaeota archaeon]
MLGNLTGFVYHEAYEKYFFGEEHPFKPIRGKLTLEILKQLNVFNSKAKIFEARPASIEELQLVHTKAYIEYVKRRCDADLGYLDYGDTPARRGVFEGACWRVGGTIRAAELVMEEVVSHAFNPGGGLHHAKENSAAGFCVFNDIAVATRFLQKKFNVKRVAIVDVDGHHADGTQQIFYNEPILTISTHRYDGIFYPGTGKIDEVGIGEGYGYSVNIPLPIGVDDETYLYCFREVVEPLIRAYKPEVIISQFGVDGHYQDPLVGLALTTKTYIEVAKSLHNLAHQFSNGKLIIAGGGGYDVKNTARCWALMFITIAEVEVKNEEYDKLKDKVKFKKDEKKFLLIKRVVEELKRKIFPIHRLEV